MTPTRTEDLVEIQQLLAKYAVTITQGDVDGLVSVFTPDGTYSAFGDTYTLNRFPVLVDAAPKGLFMTGTALVDLVEGADEASGTQPLCFIEHSKHGSLFRVHEGPTPEKRVALQAYLRALGLGLSIGDNPKPTVHPRIMKAHEEFIPWAEFETKLTALEMALNVNDVGVIRLMMQQLVAGYIPSDDIVDWVYLEQEAEAQALGVAS